MRATIHNALVAGRVAPPPGALVAPADVSASGEARLVGILLLAIGVGAALIWKENKPAFKAADGFVVLTGFYIAAQAIERLLELIPAGTGSAQARADRVVIFASLGFVLAVVLAESLGLYLLQAVSANRVNPNLDVIVTALAIGGGTKPLHDLIGRIQKA